MNKNPLLTDIEEIYYVNEWDGRGSVDEKVAASTPLEEQSFAEGWLKLQEAVFERDATRDRIMEQLTGAKK